MPFEAKAAFGNDAVYVERLIRRARHVEVQVLGDGETVTHLSTSATAPCSAGIRN
jgi:pyruvate carboxylase